MKYLYSLTLVLFLLLSTQVQGQISTIWDWDWVYTSTFNPAVTPTGMYKMTCDEQGGIYTYYNYRDTFKIAGFTAYGASSENSIIVKYDTTGKVLWAKDVSINNSILHTRNIRYSASGYIYVNGTFQDYTDLKIRHYIAKYDLNGNQVWMRTDFMGLSLQGQPPLPNIFSNRMGVDATGNVYITGIQGSTFTMGNDTFDINLSVNAKNVGCFLLKFDSSGSYLWGRRFGDFTNDILPRDIALDNNGGVIIVGSAQGADSIMFGNTPFYMPERYPDRRLLLVKYNTAGTLQWVRSNVNDQHYDVLTSSVAIDAYGDIYISGMYTDTANFGAYRLVSPKNTSGYRHYLAKYDASGNAAWAKDLYGSVNNHNNYIYGELVVNRHNELFLGSAYTRTGTGANATVEEYRLGLYDLFGNKRRELGVTGTQFGAGNTLLSICADEHHNVYTLNFLDAKYWINDTTALGKHITANNTDSTDRLYVAKVVVKEKDITSATALSAHSFGLDVFPNPANKQAMVIFTPNSSQSYSISLVDIVGGAVKSVDDVHGGRATIPVDGMPHGVYILSLKEGGVIVATHRLVVN